MQEEMKNKLAISLLWFVTVIILTKLFEVGPLGFSALIAIILMIPIFLSALYYLTIEKLEKTFIFRKEGLLRKILTGRLIGTVLSLLWSVLFSWYLLITFSFYTITDWLLLLFSLLVFLGIYQLLLPTFRKELVYPIDQSKAVYYSVVLSSFLMVILQYISLKLFIHPHPYLSLEEAISVARAKIPLTTSAFLTQIYQLATLYIGAKNYIAYKLYSISGLPIFLIGGTAIYLNFLLSVAVFIIGKREIMRALAPVVITENPKISPNEVFKLSLIATIFLMFYFPLLSQLEEEALNHPKVVKHLESYVLKVEKIGENYFRQGTLAEIRRLKLTTISEFRRDAIERLESKIDEVFDRAEENVDDFLDWYYSLKAEYLRTIKLLSGEIKSFLAEKMREKIFENASISEFEEEFYNVLRDYEKLKYRYLSEVERILEKNKVVPSPHQKIQVVKSVPSVDEIFTLEFSDELIDLKTRLTGSAFAGGAGAYAGFRLGEQLTKKLLIKLSERGILDTAAKAIIKVFGKRLGSKLAGALTGGAAGAIACSGGGPIASAVCGALGAAGGLISSLLADKALLSLEEVLERDKFKQEIISSLEEMRREYKELIRQSLQKPSGGEEW